MAHTVIKPRQPLAVIAPSDTYMANQEDENMTVEKFLEIQFQVILDEFKQHSTDLINKLRSEYEEGAKSIKDMMRSNLPEKKKLILTLKCIAGPHIGQKFRLEPANEDDEDIFKMGRSTGKHFREKGVSLYKDKEISTTHAKIEMRNGQVFLIDSKSTNGTLLNTEEVKALNPIRLKNGDIVTMGSTELMVHIADYDPSINDIENDDP